ncbi:Nucleoporin nup84 [Geranomyces michiganensis]|nr:Nucleoporin nup84 [Geranomyces michiganensis]
MATELHWWTMEASTWKLIRSLIRLRLQLGNADPPGLGEAPEELSDQEIQANLVGAQFRENMTVRRWLEETAPDFQPVEMRKGYWLHTIKHIRALNINRSASKSDVVTEADPDAALRQHKSLHPDDADYDANLHRTAYEYIRRGDFVAAADLYDACDQPWRAASLRGGVLSNDPGIGA